MENKRREVGEILREAPSRSTKAGGKLIYLQLEFLLTVDLLSLQSFERGSDTHSHYH